MSFRAWSKMVGVGLGICIGGPALIYYVSPTEEELFLKYNPELQKRSLANRRQNQQDFESFVGKLKEYSKSDRPIWEEAAADEARTRAAALPAPAQPAQPPRQLAATPPDPEAVRRQLREESLRSK